MREYYKTILTLILTAITIYSFAQEQIKPASFRYYNLSMSVPQIELGKLDRALLLEEDRENSALGNPLRVGVLQNLYYNMSTCGKVDLLPDGGKLWRLSLRSPGATSVYAHVANINIPDGALFYIYNSDRDIVVEKFGKEEIVDGDSYFTDCMPGDELIIEYYEPADAYFAGNFEIAQVGHLYKSTPFAKGYYGDATGDCHLDVTCPEANDWQDQSNAAIFLRITVPTGSEAGIYYCSAALINNVRQDGTPYVLTAHHCENDPSATYRFYFNYQATECGSASGTYGYSANGGTKRAYGSYNGSSDFMLLEITGPLNAYIEDIAFFAGWDASGNTPAPGASIHHPNGDFKKFSIPQYVSAGTGGYNKYWQTTWYPSANNKGVTEQGSSGSPLFDGNKRIVGQLYGGNSFCYNPQAPDYYGKISYSWTNNNASSNSSKLKPWLDPDNTGTMVIDGFYLRDLGVKNSGTSTPNNLNIYPNPSNGLLNIDLKNINGTASCNVYSIIGTLVYSTDITIDSSNSINLSFLDNGIYLIEVNDGKSVQTSKIIISK